MNRSEAAAPGRLLSVLGLAFGLAGSVGGGVARGTAV